MKKKNTKKKYTKKQILTGYAFLAPFLIAFAVFTILPMVASIILSFTYFNGFVWPDFVGLSNYIKLFLKDELFMKAISNTLVFALVTGPVSYFLSLILAWIISEFSPKIRSILTLIFYAPSICGGVYLVFTIIFSGDRYGWINSFLLNHNISYEPIQWTTDPTYMIYVAILVILWSSLGTSFLSFIAGFLNVDQTMYEAGAIDGVSNRWQELWYITLPSMKPQLLFGAVMSITGSFGVGPILDGVFGNPSTDYALYTMVHELSDYANTRLELGYASAIATVLFIIMLVANSFVQKIISKVGE
jgi:multiple sugar transport system permease protein